MNTKERLINIAKENEIIFKEKQKTDENVKSLNKNTKIINDIKITKTENNSYSIKDNIFPISTIAAILKLKNEGVKGEIIALNFASATNPGGGYFKGSKAQEECLCRSSLLYYYIRNCFMYYNEHKNNYSPLYSDKMIYTKDVPIIRDDKYNLLSENIKCSFLTSPAVNAKIAKKFLITNQTIKDTMDLRIQKMLSFMVSQNPEVIVLGAWGCGVFGNDRNVVLQLFEKNIRKIVPNNIRVIFAII